MSKVLITGGNGAIGRNVINEALNSGLDVVVLDNFSSSIEQFEDKRFITYSGSVEDIDLVNKILNDSVEYVIHLAALFANQNSVDNPNRDLLVNGLGSLNIARMCAKHKIKNVVYASSSCVYANSKSALNENSPIGDFDTPYALTKFIGEKYFELYGELEDLNYSIVRIFNSYGPNEHPGKYRNVIPNFIKLAIDKKPLPIYGSGFETRDFTYVTDIASGILLSLLNENGQKDIFNIGSGVSTSIFTVADLINQICNNESGIEFKSRRNWDTVTNRLADISKSNQLLNYSPKISLPDGLEKTFEWMKNKID